MQVDWIEASGLATEVLSGLLVLVIAGLASAAWKWFHRRGARRTTPVHSRFFSMLGGLVSGSRSRRLVRRVKREAKTFGKDVPVRTSGTNPVRVEYFPSGKTWLFYRDLVSYKAAAQRGEHHGIGAYWGRAPLPLGSWSTDQLRELLRKNREQSQGISRRADV